uniref:Solute carrier family 5 member 8 n=1 Tax=Pygocentrus nattereri TaxID=42514 RepID=A0AAR2IMQ9_PYGNA
VLIMLTGFLAVIIQCVLVQGGVSVIISDSTQGGRINLWDFDPNPLRRHTFWTILIGGTFIWTSAYGINQAQVQRYVSCRSLLHAKMSLYVNLLSLWAINLCSVFCGLCLYSVYKNCDPWMAKKVSSQDQVRCLQKFHKVPQLFICYYLCACSCNECYSTVSSSVNALAAVTVADLIRPYFSLSEQQLSWASKGLSERFLWSSVYWDGWPCITDGRVATGWSLTMRRHRKTGRIGWAGHWASYITLGVYWIPDLSPSP